MNTVADKIKKIIAKADSTTNPEEANSFMAKAHAMLEAHGLDLLDLGRLDSDDPIDTDVDCTEMSASYTCAKIIASTLARYYGCRLVSSTWGKKISFSVTGRQSARITFQLMFPFVWRQTQNLARQGYNAGEFNSRMAAVTRVGNALALRLHKLAQEQEEKLAQQPAGSGLNALVPVDLIQQALEEAFPDLTAGRSRSVSTTAASRALANKVSLNRAAPAPTSAKRIA